MDLSKKENTNSMAPQRTETLLELPVSPFRVCNHCWHPFQRQSELNQHLEKYPGHNIEPCHRKPRVHVSFADEAAEAENSVDTKHSAMQPPDMMSRAKTESHLKPAKAESGAESSATDEASEAMAIAKVRARTMQGYTTGIEFVVDAAIEAEIRRKPARAVKTPETKSMQGKTMMPMSTQNLKKIRVPSYQASYTWNTNLWRVLEATPQFAELPSDIRKMIWGIMTWTASRTFQIRIHAPDRLRILSDFPAPTLLINQESRNESLRCHKMFFGADNPPREKAFDLPAYARISKTTKFEYSFSSPLDSMSIKLTHFTSSPYSYDHRAMYLKFIYDNDVRFLVLDDIFLDPEDTDDHLKNVVPTWLLSNFLWRVRVGFYVPRDSEVNDPSSKIHKGKYWKPAIGHQRDGLLNKLRGFIQEYCRYQRCNKVPVLESVS